MNHDEDKGEHSNQVLKMIMTIRCMITINTDSFISTLLGLREKLQRSS